MSQRPKRARSRPRSFDELPTTAPLPAPFDLFRLTADQCPGLSSLHGALLMSPAAPIRAENRGLFWCILITLDHPPRAERASCARDMLSHPVPASSLSADWREAVAFAIRNPPSFPGRSTPSAQRLRLARLPALPSIPSQPGVARPPQLSPLNLSLATPLPPVSAESLLLLPREPRRPLPPDSRPRQLIARWGLTCVFFVPRLCVCVWAIRPVQVVLRAYDAVYVSFLSVRPRAQNPVRVASYTLCEM